MAGVILNRYPENPGLAAETNPEVIAALTGVPILGKVPEVAEPGLPGRPGGFSGGAWQPIADQLVDCLPVKCHQALRLAAASFEDASTRLLEFYAR